MAQITAVLVKELRELTGVGMMECKKALSETDGVIEKAVEYLREKGLAAASKKAGRVATEGMVSCSISDDNKVGVLIEVNSETDFVAKNQEFRNFVSQVAAQAIASNAAEVADFLEEKWNVDESITVKDALSQKIAVIGENLTIRRFAKIDKKQEGALVSYIHGDGKIAVLIELACEKQSELLTELGKNLSMQIAALNPKFVDRKEISADFIEKEREILTQQALNEGKPANVVEKMVEGRLNKELKDFCLIDQAYVKDADLTVKQYVDNVSKEVGSPISVVRFVRFETGEGLEKKQENFADEVAKTMNN